LRLHWRILFRQAGRFSWRVRRIVRRWNCVSRQRQKIITTDLIGTTQLGWASRVANYSIEENQNRADLASLISGVEMLDMAQMNIRDFDMGVLFNLWVSY
jgi:hypothetical protein